MVIVPPDGTKFGDVMVFNLAQLASRLLLVMGFSNPLSSLPLIITAIELQNDEIAAGTLSGLASFLTATFGLDIIPGPELPPWMRNAPDRTQIYMSPTHIFPIQPWADGFHN